MNNVYSANIFRFFFLLLLQILVLKYIGFTKVNIFIYPLFLMLLPLELPHGLIVLLGFIMGISIDIAYDDYGLHASVMVLLAYLRPLICMLLEPRGGYEVSQTLTKKSLGFRWFLRYSAVFVGLHLLFITTLQELSFSWFWFARIFFGFIFSLFLVILYQFIFNPKH